MTTDLFGAGFAYPLRADGAGRLARASGEERLWQSVEAILETPLGSCPLDPTFGIASQAFDPIGSPEAVAWDVARAIERCEPRAADIVVAVVAADARSVTLDVAIRPIGQNRATNRIFPIYRRV